MNKQRICIVGDGLSGLMTSIVLGQISNIEVTLISKKVSKIKDKRTTAISDANLKFLKEKIIGLNSKLFWPSKKIELFYETAKGKINFLNLNEKKSNLMYVFENDKFKKILFKEISKKKIKIIRKNLNNLKELENYNLAILCMGGNSKIYNEITKPREIQKDYNEIAVTGYVKHTFKNLNTSQFFFKDGPLAILPFSKNQFSFVWSLKKEFYNNNIKGIINLLKIKLSDILKKEQKKFSIGNIQSYPVSLNLKRDYSGKNILILGEGLHTIHPVAGQGFNLVLRDIKKLEEIVKYYSGLGISIKNSYALSDFNKSRKPENLIMGIGIDLTRNFFQRNKYLDPFKESILRNISNNETLKKFSKIISNKGISF